MEETFTGKPHPLLNSHSYQPRHLYTYKVCKFNRVAQRWVYLCYYGIVIYCKYQGKEMKKENKRNRKEAYNGLSLVQIVFHYYLPVNIPFITSVLL